MAPTDDQSMALAHEAALVAMTDSTAHRAQTTMKEMRIGVNSNGFSPVANRDEKMVNPTTPRMVMDTAFQMRPGTVWPWIFAASSTDQGTARIPTGWTTATGAMVSAMRWKAAPLKTNTRPSSHLRILNSRSIPPMVNRFDEVLPDGSKVLLTPRCCSVAPLAKRNEPMTCSPMARTMFTSSLPKCVCAVADDIRRRAGCGSDPGLGPPLDQPE